MLILKIHSVNTNFKGKSISLLPTPYNRSTKYCDIIAGTQENYVQKNCPLLVTSYHPVRTRTWKQKTLLGSLITLLKTWQKENTWCVL
jgi:hypothetical protein